MSHNVHSGTIDFDEFSNALQKIPGCIDMSKSSKRVLYKHFDVKNNGTVDWDDFLNFISYEKQPQ